MRSVFSNIYFLQTKSTLFIYHKKIFRGVLRPLSNLKILVIETVLVSQNINLFMIILVYNNYTTCFQHNITTNIV